MFGSGPGLLKKHMALDMRGGEDKSECGLGGRERDRGDGPRS